MENSDQIVRLVMDIIERDYAGQPECTPRNHSARWREAFLAAEQAGTLDCALFMQYMRHYLLGFLDPNLAFKARDASVCQPTTCGFSVRRFGDDLFVTEVREDERLVAGDAIALLDGRGLDAHLDQLIGNPVNGEDPERQLWDDALAACKQMLVRHADGTEEQLDLRCFPQPSLAASLRPPSVSVHDKAGPAGDERAVVIAAHHFVDGSVLKAMQESFTELQQADRVVVDVRTVEEGMIGNAFCLLALFFNRPTNLKTLMGQQIVHTRYTEFNARLRAQQLMRLMKMSDASGKGWVQAEIEHVATCAGHGFVKEAEFEEEMVFPPAPEGQQAFLLTDLRTSGAGERLVSIARRAAEEGCGKVRCVGRATRGSLDYASLLEAQLDERFSLVYPMSKTEAAHEGRGMLGRGIEPDVKVAFTPGECREDLVLKAALACPHKG